MQYLSIDGDLPLTGIADTVSQRCSPLVSPINIVILSPITIIGIWSISKPTFSIKVKM